MTSLNVNDIQTTKEFQLSQVTARVPDDLVAALDRAAKTRHRSRADVIRQAIETYLEDFGDLTVAIEHLQDPADESIDWDEAKKCSTP